jgi:hypothetical protein
MRLLEMNWYRIVNPGLDATLKQPLGQPLTIGSADLVDVKDVAIGGGGGQPQAQARKVG